VANFTSACIYLCSKSCLVLMFVFILTLIKNLKTYKKLTYFIEFICLIVERVLRGTKP